MIVMKHLMDDDSGQPVCGDAWPLFRLGNPDWTVAFCEDCHFIAIGRKRNDLPDWNPFE